MNSRDKSAQPVESTQSAGFAPVSQDDRSAMANPYSPAREVEVDPSPTPAVTNNPAENFPSIERTILRWIAVCGLAAAPSFVLGLAITGGQVFGMLLAILTFICFYIAGDLISRHWPIRRNIVVRRTLVFVYVTRIVISVIFPVGIYVDIMTGSGMMVVLEISGEQTPPPDATMGDEIAAIWLHYRMTFVHAIFMNILLAIFGLLSSPFVLFYTKMKTPIGDPGMPTNS